MLFVCVSFLVYVLAFGVFFLPLGGTKSYIRNKSPLKGYYTQIYKPGDPPPTGYKEGIRNTGATTTTSEELV